MSILTGLVIVVAMATLAQRSDDLIDFFLGESAAMIAPQDDEAVVAPGDSIFIDVLANDRNVAPADGAALRIVDSPACGAAEAARAGVVYIANDLCAGSQRFTYCAPRGDACPKAVVTVLIDETAAQAAPEAPQPAALFATADPAPETRRESFADGEPTVFPAPPSLRGAILDGEEPLRSVELVAFAAVAAPPGPARPVAPSPIPPDAAATSAPLPETTATNAPSSEPAATSCAALRIDAEPAPGATSRISVTAPCAAGAVATVYHAGLVFPLSLDSTGAGVIDLPVLDVASGATLRLPGGEAEPVALAFDAAEAARMVRVAVGWSAPVNLELHAFEYAAVPGGPGHVRPGATSEPRGGRIDSFAPGGDGEAPRAQVWSFRLGTGGRRGVARLVLAHPGRSAGAAFCGDGALATPEYLVIRAEGGKVRGASRRSIAAETCDESQPLSARLGSATVTEMRIE